jgi:hypothetical protein
MAEVRPTPATPQINITLSLLEDKCESFIVTAYAQNEAVPEPMEQYEFNFTINFNLNQASQQARVSSIVKLQEKQDDGSGKELAELKSTHLFFVQNFHEIIHIASNGMLLIPNPLIEVCNSISISSIRGMYSIKKENTVFRHAVLPLIDPKSLLPPAQTTAQQVAAG